MGGASLYLYLYFVCGFLMIGLGALAGILWLLGRHRRTSRGRSVALPVRRSGKDGPAT